ncbi:MAG: MFS transporter [Candidatus Latescibacterota bacterium]
MLFRFSLYGFLKNQRYFEPFLILAFLEKGLSFFAIGLLISFREVVVNFLEIPSGAVADVWGRRRSMILSFAAYIASFVLFGLAQGLPLLLLAMFFFAIGEAFRTGTHKAMIFTWLRLQGRAGERTRVYGYTRSWSKYGSAASVVLAAVFVYLSDSYVYVFYFTAVPYLLGIVNFLGYPAELDGRTGQEVSLRQVIRHLRAGFAEAWRTPGLRRVLLESTGFQGVYETTKDYLQPVLKGAAVAAAAHWAVTARLSEVQQATLLVGPVYLVLHLLGGLASRHAHALAALWGDEEQAARRLWLVDLGLCAGLGVAAFYAANPVLIACFVLWEVLFNVWRPVQLSRFDTHGSEGQGATVLSIESQARRGVTVLGAPLLGLAVDAVRAHQLGGPFWPVGLLGAGVALAFLVLSPRPVRAADGLQPQPTGAGR